MEEYRFQQKAPQIQGILNQVGSNTASIEAIRPGANDGKNAMIILQGEGTVTPTLVNGVWDNDTTPPHLRRIETDEYKATETAIKCIEGDYFIIVGQGSVYSESKSRLWTFTNIVGEVIASAEIGEIHREPYTVVAPKDAAYFYFTALTLNVKNPSVECHLSTEDGLVMKVNELERKMEKLPIFPATFLPKKVYGVIGDTMQLFDRGVTISQEPYRFYNDWICGQGKIFERYLEITPELVNGEVPDNLTIKHALINDNYDSSEQSTSELVLSARPTSSANDINVLCVGASTTANGEWASELKRRLTGTLDTGTPAADGLTHINFVGRKELAAASGVRPMPVNVEATGGWTWATFFTPQDAIRLTVSGVTSINIGDVYTYQNGNGQTVNVSVAEVNITGTSGNIRFIYNYDTQGKGVPAAASGEITRVSGSGDVTITYSAADEETYCPFSDEATGEPDFANYAQQYCNGQIDVVIFNLGTINYALVGKESLANILANMKTLIDALHADFPNCKVIIAPGMGYNTHYGIEYNYNADSKLKSWGSLYAQFRYAKAVEDFIGGDNYKDWCYLADTIAETDSEHVFPTATKPVNTRMSETEIIGTNGAHPTLQGYQMVADAIYRAFVNTIL